MPIKTDDAARNGTVGTAEILEGWCAPAVRRPQIVQTRLQSKGSQDYVVAAEAVVAPGLVVAPEIDSGEFTGSWLVVHTGSGLHVSVEVSLGLAHARELQAILLGTVIDWTRSHADLSRDPYVHATVQKVTARAEELVPLGRPLWWTTWSVRQCAPLWHAFIRDEVSFSGTFAELSHLVDDATTAETSGIDTVEFDPTPTWMLRCAAPGCCGASLTESDEADDTREIQVADRAALQQIALHRGWSHHCPGRWTCTDCTIQHRPLGYKTR